MEEVFATTERAAPPKRVVNSDFACDELLGKDFGVLYHRHCRHPIFWHTHVSIRKFASGGLRIDLLDLRLSSADRR